MKRQAEEGPAAVPGLAKQVGEARSFWEWVEPSVWTERMLTALVEGVKGGKRAQCFLCQARVVLYGRSLCNGLSIR